MNRLERGLRSVLQRPSVQNAAAPRALSAGGFAPVGGASAENAMKLSAVDRCVEVLSDSMGKLPVYVMNRETRERVDHPLNVLLGQRPNRYQTPSVVKKMVEANRNCGGNGYGWIIRNPNSLAPAEIIPVPHEMVVPVRTRSGDIYYQMTSPLTGEVKLVDHMDMIHVMAYSRNGYKGISVMERASAVITAGRTRQDYDLAYYANGGQPSGVLETDADLNSTVPVPQADGTVKDVPMKDMVRDEWEKRHSGAHNANRIVVLDHGMKYNPISISNRDAQFVEANELSVQDIARFFGVPLYKLQAGKQSYSSNEQNAIEYVVSTLQPIVTQYEEELTNKLLTTQEAKVYRIRINMMAELRGDFKSRSDWYKAMREIGGYSINDIMALEDMPDVKGGDTHMASLNYVPLEMWEELSRNRNGGNNG